MAADVKKYIYFLFIALTYLKFTQFIIIKNLRNTISIVTKIYICTLLASITRLMKWFIEYYKLFMQRWAEWTEINIIRVCRDKSYCLNN